ncbi:hypothetical protein ACIQXD_00115 [Streptomyces uncialis]
MESAAETGEVGMDGERAAILWASTRTASADGPVTPPRTLRVA